MFASDVEIKPNLDIQLRGIYKSNTYNNLGSIVYGDKKVGYHDYTLGGVAGLDFLYKDYTANISTYQSRRIGSKNSKTLANEKTWYDRNLDDLHYIGEVYIKKEFDNQELKIGRQTFDKPLVNDNKRITKNSYQGIYYKNEKDDLNIELFYFNKISASTLSNSVPYNHGYGFIGYGLGYSIGEFVDLSQHILNQSSSSDGAMHLNMDYKYNDMDISFENLYVDNLFNTSNLTGKYNIDDFYLKAGFVYQSSVGEDHVEKKYSKKLKAKFYQSEIKYEKDGLKVALLATRTSADQNSVQNGTLLSPFSNELSWIKGVNTSHALIADTTAKEFLIVKKFLDAKIPFATAYGYIEYDIGSNNPFSTYDLLSIERFVAIKGYFSKSLSLKLEHAEVKDIDLVTQDTQSTRMVLEYKYK